MLFLNWAVLFLEPTLDFFGTRPGFFGTKQEKLRKFCVWYKKKHSPFLKSLVRFQTLLVGSVPAVYLGFRLTLPVGSVPAVYLGFRLTLPVGSDPEV